MRKILIDANLLCLIAAGFGAPAAIGSHRRLKAYEAEDFGAVMDIVRPFDKIITCPHILAETSNLLASTYEAQKFALLDSLKKIIINMEEVRPLSALACDHDAYLRLGLTDAVILTIEISGAPLLTVDVDLTIAASRDGREVINYNWIRDSRF